MFNFLNFLIDLTLHYFIHCHKKIQYKLYNDENKKKNPKLSFPIFKILNIFFWYPNHEWTPILITKNSNCASLHGTRLALSWFGG
jgi:hypothetical protein